MTGGSARSRGTGGVGADPQAREDALEVLRDALAWRWTGSRWQVIEATVEALGAALVTGDAAAFRAAVYDLELAGPVRATGFEEEPTVPAPERVRERINELIHTLSGGPERTTDDGSANAAG